MPVRWGCRMPAASLARAGNGAFRAGTDGASLAVQGGDQGVELVGDQALRQFVALVVAAAAGEFERMRAPFMAGDFPFPVKYGYATVGVVEDALLRADGLTNKIEAEANRFAADLLMPWHLLRQLQAQGVTSVENLAVNFEVSQDAMSIRLLGVPYRAPSAPHAAA